MKSNWIWLPEESYPAHQTARFDAMSGRGEDGFTVAEFKREYTFPKGIRRVLLRFSADTALQLFCNGALVATGPASVGGDFLGNGKAREWYYATQTELSAEGCRLEFFARVRLMPVQICEFSKGHGGLLLTGEVLFEDGSRERIETDETWLVRRVGAYLAPRVYDGTAESEPYVCAERTRDIWQAVTAPIPPREERSVLSEEIRLAPREERTLALPLDRIYAGFPTFSCESLGTVSAEIKLCELAEEARGADERVRLVGRSEYRSFTLYSAGTIYVKLKNESDGAACVRLGFLATCYPVTDEAHTLTSDEGLNRVLNVCRHTLRYCRQTHHLDSPKHCEPLACTGDYYIESLMTAFSFGDQRLSAFDVLRTAELLRHQGGRLFHTTYSLIWVRMLCDVYKMQGDISLLSSCEDALDLLLARFATYMGENGLIEDPPDYMFVDWIYIDGQSLHHPPKCLGQSVLNMLYYMALTCAEKIYMLLSRKERAEDCARRAADLRLAVNTLLYDRERGLYFEGLNTPSPTERLYHYLPQNTEKRYYLKQSNIMAAYTSVCDGETARKLIEKVMSGECEGDVQPYFMHYLLEAIFTHGLREKYTREVIERWKKPTEECVKGLVEGFTPPEPTYAFDHSHAWGGTPLWSLPRALLGLTVEEAGYRSITLSPSLLGLAWASVELPTPCGMLRLDMKAGEAPRLTLPRGVEVTLVGVDPNRAPVIEYKP